MLMHQKSRYHKRHQIQPVKQQNSTFRWGKIRKFPALLRWRMSEKTDWIRIWESHIIWCKSSIILQWRALFWWIRRYSKVLVDYKTDYVKIAEELIVKYHTQLETYASALEKITGKHVKETYIYSFKLKQEIQLWLKN